MKGILDWIYNHIITPLTDWLRNAINAILQGAAAVIHWVQVKWTELKFHFSQWISKFYNSTAGFWTILLAVIGVVALSIYLGPQIAKVFQNVLASHWVKTFESGLANWSNKLHINLLVEVNRLAQALFPKWRQIWSGIYQDVGNIMGDIGYGFGTMAAMLTASRGVLVTWNSALGLSQEAADTTALMQMTDYMQGLSNNFDRYAQNPQEIWNDFYADVILPNTQQVNDVFGGMVKEIPIIIDRIQALEALPTKLEDFVNTYSQQFKIAIPAKFAALEGKINAQLKIVDANIQTYVIGPLQSIENSIGPLVKAGEARQAQIDANSRLALAAEKAAGSVAALGTMASFVAQTPGEIEKAFTTAAPAFTISAFDTWWRIQLEGLEYSLGTITLDEIPVDDRKIVEGAFSIPNVINSIPEANL